MQKTLCRIFTGHWLATLVYLACFLFFLGVFGTANSMLHVLPIPLILWLLPLAAAVLAGVAAVGIGNTALDMASRVGLAVRSGAILLAIGVGLTWAARAMGNADLLVYGFDGPALIGQVLLPGAALVALNLAGLWLGGRIALTGAR